MNYTEHQLNAMEQNLKGMSPVRYDWSQFAKQVSSWNKLKNDNTHDFSVDNFVNQVKIVSEEVKEAADELLLGNKSKFALELIDIAVTASYCDFLQSHFDEAYDSKNFLAREDAGHIENWMRMYELDPAQLVSFNYLLHTFKLGDYYHLYQHAINLLESIIGQEGTHYLCDGVLNANESKTPMIDVFKCTMVSRYAYLDQYDNDFTQAPIEVCAAIQIDELERKYGDRYEGITYKLVTGDDGIDRIIFVDKNNKILKPCTFQEFTGYV